MFKRIMRSKIAQIFFALILAGYMVLIKRTTRWKKSGLQAVKPIWDGGEGVIVCAWHSRFLMFNSGWSRRQQKPSVLISQSRDGALVSYTSKLLGLGVIRGSTRHGDKDKDKGGTSALRDMVRHLRADGCMVITPDGPRGPRMRMGDGPIRLAKLTGAPVMVYALSVKRAKVLRSWDRFMLPGLFSRGQIVWAGPIHVDRRASEADIEAARVQIEDMLNAATQQADKAMDRDIVLPADISNAETLTAETSSKASAS